MTFPFLVRRSASLQKQASVVVLSERKVSYVRPPSRSAVPRSCVLSGQLGHADGSGWAVMDGARTSSRVRAGVCRLCTDSDTLKHLSQPTHSHPNTAEGTHAGTNSGPYKEHFAHQEVNVCTQAGAVFSILLQQPSVRAGSAVSWAGSAGRRAAGAADAATRAGEPGLCTREVSQAGQ